MLKVAPLREARLQKGAPNDEARFSPQFSGAFADLCRGSSLPNAAAALWRLKLTLNAAAVYRFLYLPPHFGIGIGIGIGYEGTESERDSYTELR